MTHACGIAEPVTELTEGKGDKPVPWVGQFIDVVGTTERPRAARLDLTLANVAALTIDTGEACLGGDAFAYHVTTDRPVTIRFTDGRPPLQLTAGRHDGTV